LAIYILAVRGYRFKYIIVSEGNVYKKQKRMVKYYQLLLDAGLANPHVIILCGKSSTNQFMFENEGGEFGIENEKSGLNTSFISTDYINSLKDFVKDGGKKFISLKPLRELSECFCELKNEISKLDLYVYGQ
jgi:hypothetical protein